VSVSDDVMSAERVTLPETAQAVEPELTASVVIVPVLPVPTDLNERIAETVTWPLDAKTGVMNPPIELKTSLLDVDLTTEPAMTGAFAEVISVEAVCTTGALPESPPPPPPPHAATASTPLVAMMILDRVFTDRHSRGRLPPAR
jgi:hypothetical protein